MDSPNSIIICRNTNEVGAIFTFEPQSQKRLENVFGSALEFRSVFITHVKQEDQNKIQEHLVSSLLFMMSGIAESSMRAMGGVVFQDSATGKKIPRSKIVTLKEETTLSPEKHEPPKWPTIKGLRNIVVGLGENLIYLIGALIEGLKSLVLTFRWWFPRLLAFVFIYVPVVLYHLRYHGGAYDSPKYREEWYCHQVLSVDIPSTVWRRMVNARWHPEFIHKDFNPWWTWWTAAILWIYLAAQVIFVLVLSYQLI